MSNSNSNSKSEYLFAIEQIALYLAEFKNEISKVTTDTSLSDDKMNSIRESFTNYECGINDLYSIVACKLYNGDIADKCNKILENNEFTYDCKTKLLELSKELFRNWATEFETIINNSQNINDINEKIRNILIEWNRKECIGCNITDCVDCDNFYCDKYCENCPNNGKNTFCKYCEYCD
jgi:hypothetical protein